MLVTNVKVYDIEESIKASKYPMATNIDAVASNVSNNTYALAMAEIGSGHDNFLSGILVAFDLTFTNKAWVEFERYHFAQIVSLNYGRVYR